MITEYYLYCFVETNYQYGLGHWYRLSNFINQTSETYPISGIHIISFGDIKPDHSELVYSGIKQGSHFENFKTAYEQLVTIPLKNPAKTESKPYLIIDINHNSNKDKKGEISYLKTLFYTIGFYNKTNNISDLVFSAHVNPNFFTNQNSFKKSSSNSLYLLGPEFRIFSNEIMKARTLRIPNSSKAEIYNILIIAGNTDPQNRIPSILQSIKSLSDTGKFSFHIIIPNKPKSPTINNGKFFHYSVDQLPEDLNFLISNENQTKIEYHKFEVNEEVFVSTSFKAFNFYGNSKPSELIKLYPKMHAAITAAGGTFWELNSFEIPCLLIPGSSDESITARWLAKMTKSRVLLESHEQFSLEHAAKILNFLNDVQTESEKLDNSKVNSPEQKNKSELRALDSNQLTSSTITQQGTSLIWKFVLKHLNKNISIITPK